jgi:uncharacterized membrane protein
VEGTIRSIETKADAGTVFEVAADLTAYPKWASGVNSVEILETDPEDRPLRARFEVEGFVKRINYVLEYEYEYPHKIAWSAVPGDDIEEMDGYYEFKALDGGGTQILYALRVEPAFTVPGFLRRQAEKQIIGSALRGLRRRAELMLGNTG